MLTSRMTQPESSHGFEAALRRDFDAQRRFLFGLCYRMTGSAAEAEDLVQDTFERALRHPPDDAERSLRPWLARIATNLSLDHLRRRKLAAQRGSFLPEPVPTEQLLGAAPGTASAEARYDLLESATFAFMLALEALTPGQRAVLLLRDVFDYSGAETAQALELSQANVKTTLHRARQAMAAYDAERCVPNAELRKRTERALRRFVAHLATDNLRAIEALLREDVVALNDPSDEFVAARKPVVGRAKVSLFHRKIARFVGEDLRFAVREFNGLPALVCVATPARLDFAPRYVMRVDVDSAGKIRAVHTVLAPMKLARVSFEGLRGQSWLARWAAQGMRSALVRLQPRSRRISPNVKVHARSRARRAP